MHCAACSLAHRGAAVGMDDLASDVGAVARRQEDKCRRHLLGLAGALQRRVLSKLLQLLLIERARHQRRPDRAGRDPVHADALLGKLLREAASERRNGALGGGVVQQILLALVRRHTAHARARARARQQSKPEHKHSLILQLIFSSSFFFHFFFSVLSYFISLFPFSIVTWWC